MNVPGPPDWDLDWIAESIQRGQRPVSGQIICRWCEHLEHGFPCPPVCGCESTYTSRDDSWRPSKTYQTSYRMATAMNTYGVDGWVAQLVTAYNTPPGQRSPSIVLSWLKGTHGDRSTTRG